MLQLEQSTGTLILPSNPVSNHCVAVLNKRCTLSLVWHRMTTVQRATPCRVTVFLDAVRERQPHAPLLGSNELRR